MRLSDALKELLENGWEGAFSGPPTSCLLPVGWMLKGRKLEGDKRDCLAWQTLLYYYNLKVFKVGRAEGWSWDNLFVV